MDQWTAVNILYITQWYGSAGGGGEVLFRNLANGMAKRGHLVDVICSKTVDLGEYRNKTISIHLIGPELETPPPSLRQNLIYILNATKKRLSSNKTKKYRSNTCQ